MNFAFTTQSWNEYIDWQTQDKKITKKINELLK
ncbi:type II toxin-antitoxin system YoeB family toxin, partial [Commensalibacter sp. A3DC]